ncbi:MAG TPA: hypothetical protein VKC15_18575 [Gemmatimonadales bacterium]|nr:hypothetical protein [Gemmatimonadales bacterium]
MVMGRREFLSCATGALTVALPNRRWPSRGAAAVVVLDLAEHCSLRESMAGYALASAGLASHRPVLIVPAAVAIPCAAMHQITECLRAGGTVLLESGAGFAGESRFRTHRDAVESDLEILIERPRRKSRDIPYIDYVWPYATKIRDFSRVVPLPAQPGEIIARADGHPVALTRRVERGTLIYLGSPLGPALWAGDAEARQWLSRLFLL